MFKDKYKQKLKELADQFKQNPCVDCGKAYPTYVMDFDTQGGPPIKKLIRSGISIERLFECLLNCEVVCANCHRKRMYGN